VDIPYCYCCLCITFIGEHIMKILKSNYRNFWLSPHTILERVLFWKTEDEIYEIEVPAWLENICQGLYKVLNTLFPRINYIKIDDFDTWSADITMASVIHPILVELRKVHNSSGIVDNEDVPDRIKSMNAPRVETEYDIDDFYHDRWQYVLDEMIFTFDVLKSDEYFDGIDGRVQNGLRLFAKYFRSLWD